MSEVSRRPRLMASGSSSRSYLELHPAAKVAFKALGLLYDVRRCVYRIAVLA